MRVIAIRPDLIVFISRVWQTTCTAVRSGAEGFVIDSPVYPDELEALPGVLEQARFPVSGLLVTHADWDHLLGRLAFPGTPLGCAESTADRLASQPGVAQRELRAFDEQHYLRRSAPLSVGGLQSLPVPGRLSVGEGSELELHAAEGHTSDGTAYWLPWLEVLICGDYLSPVEIPALTEGGSHDRYLATLARLRGLVEIAQSVVPGHGTPMDRETALRVLDEDVAYLHALEARGADASLPAGRRTAAQRQIHAENVRRTSPGGESPTLTPRS